jgi:hypothetical protein
MLNRNLGLCLLIAATIACGSNDLITDPIVQRWCGDRPCDWEADGEIKRVGTWHPDDYAVELVSDDAKLSQLNATLDQLSSHCFSFSLIADIAPNARVFLELDFLDDGIIDFSQRLPASDWERRTFNITAPTWYRGVRFIVRKDGPGHVVLAELRAQNGGDQCTAPPVELTNRPDGAHCEQDNECTAGKCAGSVCGECRGDDDCASSQLCGAMIVNRLLTSSCVDPGSGNFGDVCSSNAQCANGFCNDGVCSECLVPSDCKDDAKCVLSSVAAKKFDATRWPKQCAPDAHSRDTGELCVSDDDCIRGTCNGAANSCAVDPCDMEPQSSICLAQCEAWSVTGGTCD